jgi:hypothetical protein
MWMQSSGCSDSSYLFVVCLRSSLSRNWCSIWTSSKSATQQVITLLGAGNFNKIRKSLELFAIRNFILSYLQPRVNCRIVFTKFVPVFYWIGVSPGILNFGTNMPLRKKCLIPLNAPQLALPPNEGSPEVVTCWACHLSKDWGPC